MKLKDLLAKANFRHGLEDDVLDISEFKYEDGAYWCLRHGAGTLMTRRSPKSNWWLCGRGCKRYIDVPISFGEAMKQTWHRYRLVVFFAPVGFLLGYIGTHIGEWFGDN